MKIMRNGKRLLATLLAAIMMVTSSGFTALAEGITYDSSGTSIVNDNNNIPNNPIDAYDDNADGDEHAGIYNDDNTVTVPDGGESEGDGNESSTSSSSTDEGKDGGNTNGNDTPSNTGSDSGIVEFRL